MRQENAAAHLETRDAMRQENAAAHLETRHHFEVNTERLETKIEFVAEAVAAVHETLDREAADIRDEMRRSFDETQSMINFSHAELDRRVGKLE